MPGNWTRTQRTTSQYNPADKTITVTWTYSVDGATVEDIIATEPSGLAPIDYESHQTTAPYERVAVYHPIIDVNTDYSTQIVNCWCASPYNVRLVSPQVSNRSEVEVVYRGRVKGFHSYILDQMDQQVVRNEDLDKSTDADGDYYKGIGVDFRGVVIQRPLMIAGLKVVVATASYESIMNQLSRAFCTTNEYGWTPPWVQDDAGAEPGEGYWLFTGIGGTTTDDFTRTTEFMMKFQHDPWKNWNQSYHRERIATNIHQGINLVLKYGDLQQYKVYYKAGDYNDFTERTCPLFDDAINNCVNFLSTQKLIVR